ncbi:hypothetical protein PF003_g11063 [Phytophthora fragariae]|nr:hypothetical protein PF003_g11063 [Phytophthora fragariae]
MDPTLQEEMERLQFSEPQLAEEKRQARDEEEADEGFQKAVKEASAMVEKAEATLKRAQDTLKAEKEKTDAAVKEAELVSWGKKKAVAAKQLKQLMGVIEATTKTKNVERAYLAA